MRGPRRLQPFSPPRPRRGASVYLAVLGVATIVAVGSLTTSVVGRRHVRESQGRFGASQAAFAARSGVEYALNWLNRNPDWRTTLTSGVLQPRWHMYSGSFRWTVTDADGDLADDPRDHAVLRCIGRSETILGEESVYVVEVDIEPAGRALTCLGSAVHSNYDVEVGEDGELRGTGIVSANHDIDGKGGNAAIDLDAEAVGKTKGGDYNAGETEGVDPREMPGEHVFDWYLDKGTEIDINAIPDAFGRRRIELRLFSRELNPFGDPDPRGIYWIDCQGQSVTLHWTRVLGTLVLLNAGPDTEFDGGALYQVEAQNYPVLMVDGDLELDMDTFLVGHKLDEAWVTNYNPPGIPYEGVTDNDKTDSYPARLEGIVYVSGTLRVSDDSTVRGSLVAGDIVINDNQKLTAEYRPYAFNYAPPGFSAGRGVRMLPGTWRRVGL